MELAFCEHVNVFIFFIGSALCPRGIMGTFIRYFVETTRVQSEKTLETPLLYCCNSLKSILHNV